MNENKNVDGLVRVPAFSHATVAGDTIYVSGTIGSRDDQFQPVSGTVGEQTTQALRNIEHILGACGASVDDVVKVTRLSHRYVNLRRDERGVRHGVRRRPSRSRHGGSVRARARRGCGDRVHSGTPTHMIPISSAAGGIPPSYDQAPIWSALATIESMVYCPATKGISTS